MDTFPKNSVALVTGSGRGLGRTIAEHLAKMGAAVAIHDHYYESPSVFGEAANVDVVAEEVKRAFAANTLAVTGDVADFDAVQAFVSKVESTLGSITLLVNAAGGDIGAANKGKPNPNDALGISVEDIRAVIDRNLIGTMFVCKAVASKMIEHSAGAIVNIASVAAHTTFGSEVAYSVAKSGIVHYTRCLAQQLRPSGIRANVVSPGPTKTARFLATRVTDRAMMDETSPSLVRYANPNEIADAVTFLASSKAKFITGQVLPVDGGMILHPS
jgi:3-oxoacyl-[acyl-carrier protein] reductase